MGEPVLTAIHRIQFGTNHMGHALLTKLLLPTLLKTAEEPGSDVRVVNLSSFGHQVSFFRRIVRTCF
jgi:NAD(P)-dependent dehydrogenase (short-subunit alcohol dehydrogenase family)